jgi:hypothetical protein
VSPLAHPNTTSSDEKISNFCVLTRCEDLNWIELAPTKFLLTNQIFFFGWSNEGGCDEQGMWHAWVRTDIPTLDFIVKLEGKKQLGRIGRRWKQAIG